MASSLLRQIEMSVDDLYPEEFIKVSMLDGASLSTMAEQYLGDPLQLYGLARYNGIEIPGKTTAGQTIRVPLTGQAKKFIASPPENLLEPSLIASGSQASDNVDLSEPLVSGGVVLTDEGIDLGAEETFEAVDVNKIELPQQAAGSNALLVSLLAEQKYKAVIEEFEGASNKDSLDQSTVDGVVEAYHREASQAFRHQDLDRAIELWGKVLMLDSDHVHASNSLIQAQELKQKLQRLE